MKYARKMMVVPFTETTIGRTPTEQTEISDKVLSKIITNPNLTTDQKSSLYSHHLNRNKAALKETQEQIHAQKLENLLGDIKEQTKGPFKIDSEQINELKNNFYSKTKKLKTEMPSEGGIKIKEVLNQITNDQTNNSNNQDIIEQNKEIKTSPNSTLVNVPKLGIAKNLEKQFDNKEILMNTTKIDEDDLIIMEEYKAVLDNINLDPDSQIKELERIKSKKQTTPPNTKILNETQIYKTAEKNIDDDDVNPLDQTMLTTPAESKSKKKSKEKPTTSSKINNQSKEQTTSSKSSNQIILNNLTQQDIEKIEKAKTRIFELKNIISQIEKAIDSNSKFRASKERDENRTLLNNRYKEVVKEHNDLVDFIIQYRSPKK